MIIVIIIMIINFFNNIATIIITIIEIVNDIATITNNIIISFLSYYHYRNKYQYRYHYHHPITVISITTSATKPHKHPHCAWKQIAPLTDEVAPAVAREPEPRALVEGRNRLVGEGPQDDRPPAAARWAGQVAPDLRVGSGSGLQGSASGMRLCWLWGWNEGGRGAVWAGNCVCERESIITLIYTLCVYVCSCARSSSLFILTCRTSMSSLEVDHITV